MRHRLLALLSVLPGAAACGGAAAPAAPPPDVVVLVLDTLRADHLSAYGYPRPTSPELERLAAEGVLAEDVTAQCAWTLPSMVSMFQGRYGTSYRDVYQEGVPTLAEHFRAAGYRTLGVVGNGLVSARAGFGRGFEHYDDRRSAEVREGSAARTAEELLDAAWGPLARALTPDADGERPPLFLYLHFMDPHGPYRHQPDLEAELPTAEGAARVDFAGQRARFAAARPDVGGVEPAWAEMALEVARYDHELRHTDRHLARLLGFLRDAGALENAIVAVVSDHGEGLWQHESPAEARDEERSPRTYFFQTHGKQVYQELVATPMILWGRGVPAGLRLRDPVENVDLFPTLVDLAGLERPPGLHGRSLVDAMSGAPVGRELVFTAVLQERSVREVATGWKLIEPTEPFRRRGTRLYDLGRDPGETVDRAAEHPDVVARLGARLAEWVAAYPVESNLGQPKDERTLKDLRELGYAGDED